MAWSTSEEESIFSYPFVKKDNQKNARLHQIICKELGFKTKCSQSFATLLSSIVDNCGQCTLLELDRKKVASGVYAFGNIRIVKP